MSLPKIFNLGSRIFSRSYEPLSKYSIINVKKLDFINRRFFSSFYSFDKSVHLNKLILNSYNPFAINFRGMKVKGNLVLRCKNCYFERKDGVLHVMCSSYPRHKQRAQTKREKYTWILTFASQSKFRPY